MQRRERSGIKTGIVCKRISKHPYIFAIFKVDSEYLRFPFKLKVDYFILYSILVSTFVIFFLLFFYEQKKTHERSVPAIIVSFTKGFSRHPHILAISKVDSEYSRVPFKVMVDYFIFYSILVSTFVIFLLLFPIYERKKTYERSREQFFHSNVYMFKRNRNQSQTIKMLAVLRNRPDISCHYQR